MPYCRPGKGSSQGADRSIAGCDGPCAKRYARVFPAPWRDLRYRSTSHAWLLTVLAMFAFAGNSLLCRAALQDTTIDAATFTSLRLAAGALTLWAIAQNRLGGYAALGSWASALSLFVYAAGFSFAYRGLSAGVGALLREVPLEGGRVEQPPLEQDLPETAPVSLRTLGFGGHRTRPA